MSESPIFDQVYREFAERGKHYEKMVLPILTQPVLFNNMYAKPASEAVEPVMQGQLKFEETNEPDTVALRTVEVRHLVYLNEGNSQE